MGSNPITWRYYSSPFRGRSLIINVNYQRKDLSNPGLVMGAVMCESGHLESESGSESRHLESESRRIRIHLYFLESESESESRQLESESGFESSCSWKAPGGCKASLHTLWKSVVVWSEPEISNPDSNLNPNPNPPFFSWIRIRILTF